MPNQHHPDKEVMGFYIPRTLAAKVRRAATHKGISITSLIQEVLSHATHHTHLTPEDFRDIAKRKKRAVRRSTGKKSGSKNSPGGKK